MSAHAQEMYSPEFSRLLRGCTPVSHVSRFYGLGSTWRHYEESAVARQLPEGLLLLGDSICSFQPVYGQGMTVAAQQVEVLDRLLSQRPGSDSNSSGAGGLPAAGAAAAASASSSQQQQLQLAGLSAEFQAAVLPLVRASWDLAVGSDMKYAGAVSSEAAATGLPAKLKQELQEAIFELATYDEVVSTDLTWRAHHDAASSVDCRCGLPPRDAQCLLHTVHAQYLLHTVHALWCKVQQPAPLKAEVVCRQ